MDPNHYRHCTVVDIARQPLDAAAAIDFVSDDAHGGLAVFVGKVRRQSHGRAVIGIDYDLYEPLTLRQFERACATVLERYGPVLKLYVAHAYGSLKLGDLAVVVAAGSPHRDEAFRACRDLIEAVKHEAPIWKREHYVDGSSEWSEGCSLCYRGEQSPAPPAAHGHDCTDHTH
ncbi:MAG: molybdenum cofactor biosynthesis protein MoaE [Xanthomonadales bacterium]|nr:molybdenum cofactor biosynthesis protein MoaE [Xanthomonadales bacterium]